MNNYDQFVQFQKYSSNVRLYEWVIKSLSSTAPFMILIIITTNIIANIMGIVFVTVERVVASTIKIEFKSTNFKKLEEIVKDLESQN